MAEASRKEVVSNRSEAAQQYGNDREPVEQVTPPSPPPGGQNGPPSRGGGDEDQ